MKVKIIGAGSIGNHLAQASRRAGWDVAITDADPAALERTRTDIYPARYGAWDENIKLFRAGEEPKTGCDVIMIGTPPDSHMKLSLAAIAENPRLLHIEKPLATPDLAGVADFEAEISLAFINRAIVPDIETLFQFPYRYLDTSSSLVRELASHASLRGFLPDRVPGHVMDALLKK